MKFSGRFNHVSKIYLLDDVDSAEIIFFRFLSSSLNKFIWIKSIRNEMVL